MSNVSHERICLLVLLLPTVIICYSDLWHTTYDPLPDFRGLFEGSPQVTNSVLEKVFKVTYPHMKDFDELERKLIKKGYVINSKQRTADINMFRNLKAGPTVHRCERTQRPFQVATEYLITKHNATDKDIATLSKTAATGKYFSEATKNCMNRAENKMNSSCNSRFRSIDGTCNNLGHLTWGSAFHCFQRLLPAYYEGASGFRQSVLGGPLPKPRILAVKVLNNIDRPTNDVSHLYQFFGQLLSHDINFTPSSATITNEAINCCPDRKENHPQCAPILIQEDDPFFSQFDIQCMNFVRSAICPTCAIGKRVQMNIVTSFIDASVVYGNSLDVTFGLRTNDGSGKLRTESTEFGDVLPPSADPENDQCSFPETNEICFDAGDVRVNQHTTLACLQTIFLREHNRIADELHVINPHWKSERLFQEARKIVGAEMQAITYKEYLPLTIGDDSMMHFSLRISEEGRTEYDPSINPTMYTEFSTAGYRFGHSMINGIIANSPRNRTNGKRWLRDDFAQPFELRDGIAGPLMCGVSTSPCQLFDRHIVHDVTNFLYRVRGSPTGFDLASINVQRGRDHGLPPYTEMVRYCLGNKSIIQNFNDLSKYNLMSKRNAQLLKRHYRDVNDIDPWIGLLSEYPNPGAIIGPTATCLIGLQFQKLKFGDRFYFEHWNESGSFTYGQVEELKKTSISKIICDNTDVEEMAVNSMSFSSRHNPTTPCEDLPGVDLSFWEE